MPPTEIRPIRACIVDDEAPGRANLRLALAAYPQWQVVGECASAEAARALLAHTPADVLFLDIQMPGESGLALARSLSRAGTAPLLVFVTAHNSYAVDAFDLHALDYLIKPWHSARFAQALARVQEILAARQTGPYQQALLDYLGDDGSAWLEVVTVRSVGHIERLAIEKVDWIESAGNYVELHCQQRSLLHRISLGALETRLNPQHYLRVHRTAIVRRAQCAVLLTNGDGRYQLTLHCGATVPVSERYVAAARSCIASRY